MVSRRSFMTSALGIAAGVLTQGAQALTDLRYPLPIFPNEIAKWKRSWDQATTTLAGNTRTLATYSHPVLIEGPGYPGIWMECGPTEALVNLQWKQYLPEPQREVADKVAIANHMAFFEHQRPDGQMLDASDVQMERHLAEIVQRLPAGIPGDTERGRQFVLDHVSPRDLAKSRRVSTGAAVSVLAALALSVGLGLLPKPIELIVLLPVIVVTLVLMVRAYVLGTRRVRLLSQFRHRGAAGRASAMLAMAFLLYFGGIALIATQAIPALTKLRTAANELSAINSLRVIDIAQLQYQATYPDRGFACLLSQLGGDPAAGAPTADAAQMISPDLAAGMRAGYRFTLACPRAMAGERAAATAFLATGVPYASGKGRNRGFCTDQSGVITVDPNGGTDCKEPLK